MIHQKRAVMYIALIISSFYLTGCGYRSTKNEGLLQSYPTPSVEAGWIRDGQPIDFDGHKWYPADDVEVLLDSDVYQVGEHKGTQIFVDKIDTKPYRRIYTKFSRNKFRYFEQRSHD